MNIQAYSQGKVPERNEDTWGNDDNTIVVADGATDKSGKLYDGKTGGEILSKFIVAKCLASDLTGIELVNDLTQAVRDLYTEINPAALSDPKLRFSSTVVCVRIISGKILVTQVGDTSFRINGTDVFQDHKLVDTLTANARADYIRHTGDVAGGRDFIMPILKEQVNYQNNADHVLGHGCIDGTDVPTKFIKQFEFAADEVQTLEIFTDGYYAVPTGREITDWEELHKTVEAEDPQKYLKFLSTKPSDDRTVVIAIF